MKEVQTVLVYTDGEKSAIAALTANRGTKLSAKELGVPAVLFSSINKKAAKVEAGTLEVTEDQPIFVNSEDRLDICPNCGAKHQYKVYWIN